jgi:hypothetical protein
MVAAEDLRRFSEGGGSIGGGSIGGGGIGFRYGLGSTAPDAQLAG